MIAVTTHESQTTDSIGVSCASTRRADEPLWPAKLLKICLARFLAAEAIQELVPCTRIGLCNTCRHCLHYTEIIFSIWWRIWS
jgi:hypothetical protein